MLFMEHRPIILSIEDDAIAAEKGRLLAAQAIANHPDQKKRVEDVYGVEYCKARYPEAYRGTPFFRSILDKIKFITH